MPFLGGNWNNGSGAGVFAMNLNNPRSNSGTNIGFRSALPSSRMPGPYGARALRGPGQRRRIKGFISLPKGRKINGCEALSNESEKRESNTKGKL